MSDLAARLSALEHRVGELEDINAIRRLHWAYGYYIDFNRAEDVVQLFAKDGAVVFLSGEYRGHEGVRRLYGTWFQNFFTQRGRMARCMDFCWIISRCRTSSRWRRIGKARRAAFADC